MKYQFFRKRAKDKFRSSKELINKNYIVKLPVNRRFKSKEETKYSGVAIVTHFDKNIICKRRI